MNNSTPDLQALIELSKGLRAKVRDFETVYATIDGYIEEDVEELLQAIQALSEQTAPTLPGAGGGDGAK